MPLVSVIIPVYNTEKYLNKCVDSVLIQTLNDIEIILVDDGSSDNSPRICDDYANIDSRIKVIHKENGGLSSARNAALKICQGEYIGFVDSDDCIDQHMFEILYNSAKKHNSDVAICAHFTVNENINMVLLPFDKELYVKEEIIENFIIPLLGEDYNSKIQYLEGFVWRQIFKKDLVKNLHFKSEKKYFAEDVIFDFDAYQVCNRISIVNEPLYYYRYNTESLSNKYRCGIWDILCDFLDYKLQIVDKLNISNMVQVRLNNEIIKFIKFSILNLNKTGCDLTDPERIQVLKNIENNRFTKKVLQFEIIKKQSFKTKVLLILLKLRFEKLILFISKGNL